MSLYGPAAPLADSQQPGPRAGEGGGDGRCGYRGGDALMRCRPVMCHRLPSQIPSTISARVGRLITRWTPRSTLI
jgi:hypothetical protein